MNHTQTKKEVSPGSLMWLTYEGYNCWLLEWIDYSPNNDKLKKWCKDHAIGYYEEICADAPYYEYRTYISNIDNYDIRFALGLNTNIYEDGEEF